MEEVRALRPDMLGTWLPIALCMILRQLCASWGGRPPTASEVFRAWGLDGLAEDMETGETRNALQAFADIMRQPKQD